MLEILAPAGGFESLTAALNTGADAVYLGLDSFSARKKAANFTEEELRNAVREAHLNNARIYVALNTLVFDEELPQLREAILSAKACGVDAFIVQDLGVAAEIRRLAPEIPLHASTQMTITSLDGALAVKRLGFTRAVLARELSFEEIKHITEKSGIEIEVFIHGALCVSVSGQCYMSSVLGGRSGNRGLCAQPCRLGLSCDGRENVISLKDLSIITRLKELEEIGVTSAKIEGRMKRPEYVAAAVTACRSALAGERPDIDRLRSVFSRSGFTTGYYDDYYSDMNGIRTKEDVEAATSALNGMKALYSKPYQRHKTDFSVTVKANIPVHCVARVEELGVKAEISGDIPAAAAKKALTSDYVQEQMGKLGGTVFFPGDIQVILDEGLFLSAAQLNELRRNVIAKLTEEVIGANTRH